MNKILELLKQEIDETNHTPKSGYGTTALLNNTHSDGYVSGLEKAIELIKVQSATEVVNDSIMHGEKNKDINGTMKCITIVYELHIKSEMETEDLEYKVQLEVEQLIIANSSKLEGIVYSINSK